MSTSISPPLVSFRNGISWDFCSFRSKDPRVCYVWIISRYCFGDRNLQITVLLVNGRVSSERELVANEILVLWKLALAGESFMASLIVRTNVKTLKINRFRCYLFCKGSGGFNNVCFTTIFSKQSPPKEELQFFNRMREDQKCKCDVKGAFKPCIIPYNE